MFFFVLSGFVLSLQFMKPIPPRYLPYLVKRVSRLYIPYASALVFAGILKMSLRAGPVGTEWGIPLTLSVLADHFLMIGSFSQSALDPVIWSLVNEMRISIVFPFLVFLIVRLRAALSILFLLICYVTALLLHGFFYTDHFFTNFQDTLSYILMFGVGVLLAKYKWALGKVISQRQRSVRVTTLLFGLLLYTYSATVQYRATELYEFLAREHVMNGFFYHLMINWGTFYVERLICTIGAATVMIVVISSTSMAHLLKHSVPLLLGRMSYSLYLFHFPILLGLLTVLPSYTSTGVIWALFIPLTFCISYLSYRYIERPSTNLGRHLAEKLVSSAKDVKGMPTSAT